MLGQETFRDDLPVVWVRQGETIHEAIARFNARVRRARIWEGRKKKRKK